MTKRNLIHTLDAPDYKAHVPFLRKLKDYKCVMVRKIRYIIFDLFFQGLTDRARRTCPEGIIVTKSKIRSGGLGVWAEKDFVVNSVFGPYEGVAVHKDDLQKLSMTFDGGYAWEVEKMNT